MKVQPHERFTAEVRLTPATVSAFAHTVGDVNPVHHDPHYAATTRYQRPTRGRQNSYVTPRRNTRGSANSLPAPNLEPDTQL